MIKHNIFDKGVVIPLLWSLMLFLFPVLIWIVPKLVERDKGNFFASAIMIWGLGIITIIFIIILYLINVKRSTRKEV